MNNMMEQCCGTDGRPDFDMMKQFMSHCGKSDFTNTDLERMKQFCCAEDMPGMSKMMDMMKSCGCQVPESAAKE
jgi:hypothetical protein